MKRMADHRRNLQDLSCIDLDQFVFNLESFCAFEYSVVFP
jgi:hypothetical protein